MDNMFIPEALMLKSKAIISVGFEEAVRDDTLARLELLECDTIRFGANHFGSNQYYMV